MNLSLAEKYRPRKLEDFALSKSVESFVTDILKEGISQNLLFHGPAGTGKSSLAFLLRDYFNVAMATLEINASEETGIDTIRDTVKRFVSTSALGCEFKLCILSEVDGLSRQAQQALKDILEASARSGTYFILTTNRPEKLIEEIISRCMSVKVEPDQESYEKVIEKICEKEDIVLAPAQSKTLLTKFYPDLRRSLNWIESGFVGSDESLKAFSQQIWKLIVKSKTVDDLPKLRKFWIEEISSSSEYELLSGEMVDTVLEQSKLDSIKKIKMVRSLNTTLNHYAARQDRELNFYCSIIDLWEIYHEN